MHLLPSSPCHIPADKFPYSDVQKDIPATGIPFFLFIDGYIQKDRE